ncbi:MAG: cyclic nucleotide-binding domain-containing protein, partial [Alphaproteobacteria bacterium]|nr:cyclic nucleotide-binding domain-containing protein [Alphaproteobacteria bacterium]
MAAEVAEKIALEAGQYLFHEGESGDRAYLVASGRIEISKKAEDDVVVLAVVGRGEFVGEMALVDDFPRMASARAIEPTALVVVTRDSFTRKVSSLDHVGQHL